MILVSGVSGNIGGELAKLLVADGQQVRGLTRDAKKAASIDPKVEVVEGDFAKPESLEKAFAGVEKAFFVAHAGPELADLGGAFFDAAKKAGVKHVVVVSSSTIGIEPPSTIGKWHRAMEERLEATGLAWTMLRPGNFATNALRWAPMIKAQGAVYIPSAAGKSAPIDPRDIAAVAAVALTKPGHEGKIHWLIGSETMSAREQVEEIGAELGKQLRVVEVSFESAKKAMLGQGMPEMMADAVLELIRPNKRSEKERGEGAIKEITGKEARGFADWVKDNIAAFS